MDKICLDCGGKQVTCKSECGMRMNAYTCSAKDCKYRTWCKTCKGKGRMPEKKPYKEWFKEVQELSLELYGLSVTDTLGWEEYYNNGYTPKDALQEDISYG